MFLLLLDVDDEYSRDCKVAGENVEEETDDNIAVLFDVLSLFLLSLLRNGKNDEQFGDM